MTFIMLAITNNLDTARFSSGEGHAYAWAVLGASCLFFATSMALTYSAYSASKDEAKHALQDTEYKELAMEKAAPTQNNTQVH